MVDVPAGVASTSPTTRPHTGRFAALHVPAFRVLWTSSLFLFFVIQAQVIARGWLAIQLTGTSAGVGGAFLAFGLPGLVFSPIGGVVADRFPKRNVLLGCNVAIFVSSALIAVGVEAGFLAYWMLLTSGAIQGAAISVMGPARMAFMSDLVERPLLPNAAVLQQMTMNSTKVLGPAIAGALIGIEAIGAGGVYVMTSLLVVIGAVITNWLPIGAPHGSGIRPSPWVELVEGVRYVRSQRQVLLLLSVSTVIVAACHPFQAMLPALAIEVFDAGSSGYGTMMAVSAIGALTVTFWIAGLVHRMSVWRLQAICGLGFALGVLFLGVVPTLLASLPALVLLGGAASGYQATNAALVLMETELEYHGRVQSLSAIGYSLAGIMALPLGFVADSVGLQTTLVAMGMVGIGATAWYTFVRRRFVAAEESLTY